MSDLVERFTQALIEADAKCDGFPDYSEMAVAVIKEIRALIDEALAEVGAA